MGLPGASERQERGERQSAEDTRKTGCRNLHSGAVRNRAWPRGRGGAGRAGKASLAWPCPTPSGCPGSLWCEQAQGSA